MKFILIIFTAAVLLSCVEASDSGTFEKKERLEHENDSLAKIVIRLEHENDSLRNIATRWEYGRDSHLYANDFEGGNSMSWRYKRSLEQLKFDPSLLDSSKFYNEVEYNWKSLEATDVDKSVHRSVDTEFEADRCNYYMAVVYTNAMNEAVYSIAFDLAKQDPNWTNANVGGVADIYAGLIYRSLYDDSDTVDSTVELLSEVFKKNLEKSYKLYHAGIRR